MIATTCTNDTTIDTTIDVHRDVTVDMMRRHGDAVRQRGSSENDWASRTGDRTTMSPCLRLVSSSLFAPRYASRTIVVSQRFGATTL
jgi:hypothetical protein